MLLGARSITKVSANSSSRTIFGARHFLGASCLASASASQRSFVTTGAKQSISGPAVPSSSASQEPSLTRGAAAAAAPGSSGMAADQQEVAIVGGGCFWCIEACYNQLKGVSSAISGYAGGHVENPTYEQVCDKKTGHAEVIKVTYDPSIIDYKTILEVFFTMHDPTTKDRQGNDVGPQYRSIIMYMNEDQKRVAEEVIADITEQKLYPGTVVTEVVPASKFWEAEKYHQRYYQNNPNQGYCSYVVAPKVAKFRAKWAKRLAA